MIVDPTNENPRAFRSFEIASESSVRAGICFWSSHVLTTGLPPVQFQSQASKLPSSSWISRKQRAFLIDDSTFSLLRMMPGSPRRRSNVARGESGNTLRVEPAVGLRGSLPPLEDGEPAQPCLGGLQHEELEVPDVVVHRRAPFPVMIGNAPLVGLAPGAAAPVFSSGVFRSSAPRLAHLRQTSR